MAEEKQTVEVKLESFEIKNTSLFNYENVIKGLSENFQLYVSVDEALQAYLILRQIGSMFCTMPFGWVVLLASGKYTVETNSETKISQFTFTQEFSPDLLPISK
jgi:hypothetical protein